MWRFYAFTVSGLGLFLLAGASSVSSGVPHGPSWQILASAMFGILLAMIGAFAKGVATRVDNIELRIETLAKSCADLKEMVLKDYHSKDDLREIINGLKDSINRLHSRLVEGDDE